MVTRSPSLHSPHSPLTRSPSLHSLHSLRSWLVGSWTMRYINGRPTMLGYPMSGRIYLGLSGSLISGSGRGVLLNISLYKKYSMACCISTSSVTMRKTHPCLLLLLSRPIALVLGCRVEDVEEPLSAGRHLEDTGHIPAPVAVVWRAPDCRELVVELDGEALHAQLVGAEDMVHAVQREELLDDRRAECISCSSGCQLLSLLDWPVGPTLD